MLKLLHEVGRSVAVLHEDALLFVYRHGAGWSKPHFHPLYAPLSARVMTLHAPHDWVHHRGLMWSWGRVAPKSDPDSWVNFWEERVRTEDDEGRITWPRPLDDAQRGIIRHSGFRNLEPGRQRALLLANHDWLRAGSEEPLMHSEMDVVVNPMREDGWFFDLQFTLRAASETVLLLPPAEDSLYEEAPYGLACQFSRELSGGALLNADDKHGLEAASESRWTDYSGIMDDDECQGCTRWLGITLFDHPENPRYPSRFVALTGSAPFLSAAPLGDEAIEVTTDSPLSWRYRVWVHSGRGELNHLNALADEFAASESMAATAFS